MSSKVVSISTLAQTTAHFIYSLHSARHAVFCSLPSIQECSVHSVLTSLLSLLDLNWWWYVAAVVLNSGAIVVTGSWLGGEIESLRNDQRGAGQPQLLPNLRPSHWCLHQNCTTCVVSISTCLQHWYTQVNKNHQNHQKHQNH